MKLKNLLAAALLSLSSAASWAGTTDLLFPPVLSGGHDFNHAPIGQSFIALAPHVKAGIYIADEDSFTNWLALTYSGLTPYPYAIAPSLTVNVQLLQGEGTGGAVLDSVNLTLNKPFMGFVEVDYGAIGVNLVPGSKYTLLMTDVSGQSYPNGVTGWVVPSVNDYSTGASLPPGAYAYGQPILQGAIVTNDAGIGDNSFEVIDTDALVQPTTPLISGTLPYGVVGSSYYASLGVSGGTAPYTWSANTLPAGLTLSNGVISGIPTTAGTFNITVTVTDANGARANAAFATVISAQVCSGTKAVISDVFMYFMNVNGGLNLADHVWYAPQASTTFTGGTTNFAPGELVSYVGDLDPQSGCHATSMTVMPAPAPLPPPSLLSCTKPKLAKVSKGKGSVTAAGSNYIMVKTVRIDYASCTSMNYGGNAKAPAVGDRIEWEGYIEPNGNVMGQTLTFN